MAKPPSKVRNRLRRERAISEQHTSKAQVSIRDGLQTKETVSFGPLEDLFGYQLRRAWTVLRKDFTASVEGLGLRHLSFSLLSLISDNPGINQGRAGKVLDIQRPNMVALITELTDRGWVERRKDPEDRRALALFLTDDGQRILTEGFARIEQHESLLLASLSEAEKAVLFDMLKRISAPRIES
ncbi:MarR family winged helix-turn-helix transcriptional regulator [Altericroceibacterium spongiae]|uniref:MarR family winged helix-turn-helix transcriptional regulator n=1 Tax=Altericroceibacterium spongiae TaxID=2320269 RepID=UPI001604277D|nr:MarR family transcriptional regulator [Altericroceibacterium spongiae]